MGLVWRRSTSFLFAQRLGAQRLITLKWRGKLWGGFLRFPTAHSSRPDDVYAKLLCTLFTRGRTGEPMQIAFNETQLFNFTGSVTVPTWLHVAYYIIVCYAATAYCNARR